MKEEMLEKIREESFKEYMNLKDYNRKVYSANEFLSKKEAKDYFELTKETPRKFEYKEINIPNIMYSVFEEYSKDIKSDETNDIYVYRGTYRNIKPLDDNQNAIVSRNSKDAEYSIYSNIEKYSLTFVNIQDRDEFERNHNIILDENYYDVRREFALTAINESQEKAVNKILKRCKR